MSSAAAGKRPLDDSAGSAAATASKKVKAGSQPATAPSAPLLLYHAGMKGALPGEPAKGYTKDSGTAALKDEISPRVQLGSFVEFRGPVLADGSAPAGSVIGTADNPTAGLMGQ